MEKRALTPSKTAKLKLVFDFDHASIVNISKIYQEKIKCSDFYV